MWKKVATPLDTSSIKNFFYGAIDKLIWIHWSNMGRDGFGGTLELCERTPRIFFWKHPSYPMKEAPWMDRYKFD